MATQSEKAAMMDAEKQLDDLQPSDEDISDTTPSLTQRLLDSTAQWARNHKLLTTSISLAIMGIASFTPLNSPISKLYAELLSMTNTERLIFLTCTLPFTVTMFVPRWRAQGVSFCQTVVFGSGLGPTLLYWYKGDAKMAERYLATTLAYVQFVACVWAPVVVLLMAWGL
ncbi:hypothetical protein MBLNU230_g7308t1 [Neophaeotheca triangularis]